MRLILVMLAMGLGCGAGLGASEPSADATEARVAALVAGPAVTVVHFWAPWCSNCKAEMRREGWMKFVEENPAVNVVFINIWHGGRDGRAELRAAGLGGQANFTALTHANPSRKAGERLERFLDLSVTWVPTTWVYRDGKLRYALNYGEVRFEMLRQMVRDAAETW